MTAVETLAAQVGATLPRRLRPLDVAAFKLLPQGRIEIHLGDGRTVTALAAHECPPSYDGESAHNLLVAMAMAIREGVVKPEILYLRGADGTQVEGMFREAGR